MPLPLTRHSKIKDAWRNPVGHDLLLSLMRQLGRDEAWPASVMAANKPLASLDRLAGPGFADLLVEMAGQDAERPAPAAEEQHAWWKQAVVYRVYLPSFMDSDHDGIGDLNGVSQRLPYLAGLGVDTLLLWPFLDAEGAGGRAVRDHRAPNPDCGTVGDFEALAQLAHARGMRVLVGMDLLVAADSHPWFQAALRGGDERAFFVLRPGEEGCPPNNWGRPSSGSMWRWVPELSAWALSIYGTGCLDLNWDAPELRAQMADILHFWAEKGADGFWLGSANMVNKGGFGDGNPAIAGLTGVCGYERLVYGPRLHRTLRELRAGARLPGDAVLIGEVRGIGPGMARQMTGDGRHELDLVTDPGHLAARGRSGQDDARMELADLKQYYLQWTEQFGADRWPTVFFETPELPRMVSRLGANPLYRPILSKLLATLLFTLRGTPMLYQGQELGLGNVRITSAEELRDPAALRMYGELCGRQGEAAALQKAVEAAGDHARVPMPWSAGPGAGFTGARPWMRPHDGADYLNAAAQMEDRNSVWRYCQQLIALRKETPCLIYGSFTPVFVKNRRVFCYFRMMDGGKWYVEMNLTGRETPRPGRILRSMRLVLSNYDAPARALRPYEANLYHCE